MGWLVLQWKSCLQQIRYLAIRQLCPLRGSEGKDFSDCTENMAEWYQTSELRERYHLQCLTDVSKSQDQQRKQGKLSGVRLGTNAERN